MQHGSDGWVLEDMEWDENDGVARLEYSNRNVIGTRSRFVDQPTRPGHKSWLLLFAEPQTVMTIA